MKKVFKLLKPYTFLIILNIICIFIQSMTNLSLPNIMSKMVNEGVANSDLNIVLKHGRYMLYMTLGAMLFNILAVIIAAFVSSKFARKLRNAVYKKVEEFSLNNFNKIPVSSLLTRTTTDVNTVKQLTVIVLRMMIQAPLMCIGGIIMSVTTNIRLSVIFLVVIPIILLVILLLSRIIVPLFTKYQEKTDRLNQIIREKLTGVKVIRAFNTEKYEEERFDVANKDIYNLNIKIVNTFAFLNPLVMFIINVTTVIVTLISTNLINENLLEIGSMIAFIQYATQVLLSILMISMLFIMIPKAVVSLKRIAEVLNTESEIKENENNVKVLNNKKGEVEFKNVSFKYEHGKEDVLSNISFKIDKGETVAIIGATGSGKSTILNLLLRFFDSTKGKIFVGGEDIKKMSIKDLRNMISFVPQKNNLFTGTIKDNIAYGNKEASLDDVILSSKISCSYEFINKLENKFEHVVSEGGMNFSGGQKQRLTIARAVCKNSDIYVFDDSFSALDFATDKKVRSNIIKYFKDKTVIIVAQRVSTILGADKIIYIDEGKIIDIGNHKELYNRCPMYKELVLSQITEKEALSYEKK